MEQPKGSWFGRRQIIQSAMFVQISIFGQTDLNGWIRNLVIALAEARGLAFSKLLILKILN